MDEVSVIYSERVVAGAEFHQARHVLENAAAEWLVDTIVVDCISLLRRMTDSEIVLVRKFIARENHWDTDGRQQADKSQLDALFGKKDSVVLQKVEEPLIAEAPDVMRAKIVHRLCSVAKPQDATVNHLAHRPFKTRLFLAVLSENRRAHHSLELFIPEP